MMVHELLDLWQDRPDRPSRWPVYVGAPLIVAGRWRSAPLAAGRYCYPRDCPDGDSRLATAGNDTGGAPGVCGRNATLTAVRVSRPGSIALSVLAMLYAGLLLSFLVNLRLVVSPRWGMAALISLIVVVKLSDTGAYFVGRRFGRHKMAPILSPKKTWEGRGRRSRFCCFGSLAMLRPDCPRAGRLAIKRGVRGALALVRVRSDRGAERYGWRLGRVALEAGLWTERLESLVTWFRGCAGHSRFHLVCRCPGLLLFRRGTGWAWLVARVHGCVTCCATMV